MPVGVDKEVETAVEYIGGKLHLPPAMHEALGFDYLTLSEQSLAHIASIELVNDAKKGVYFAGFHYDPHGMLRSSGILNLAKFTQDPVTKMISFYPTLAKKKITEFIEVDENITKTLFYDHWTLPEILTKAQEALKNISEIPELKRGRYRPQGKTNCGITIQFVFDSTGNIVSFFPIIEKVTT